jgi:MFS family permease
MTCDEYYNTHPGPALSADRCSIPEVDAVTSREVALLGFSTTLFGVVNLFVTGYTIRRFGIKSALAIQVFWPAARLAVQNVGVMAGGRTGILIVQSSQIITIVGGPAGYILALNSFVTEIVEPSERTGALGRLQGCTLFGTALGYLIGGLLSDIFGIITPFRVTLGLFLSSTVYVLTCLPWVPRDQVAGDAPKGLARFFGPLKMFKPQRWVLADGRTRLEYGAILLAMGVFFGVLATGYIPVLLQMYSTDVFGFGTTENGYLISVYSLLRGLFLMFAFPRLISKGREISTKSRDNIRNSQDESIDPANSATVDPMEDDEVLEEPVKRNELNQTFEFDLLYTKLSLIADGLLTGMATFITQGWQLYLLAVLLPFSAGTGSAAKGTILQMCPDIERSEALSGITLVDMIARLSTSMTM